MWPAFPTSNYYRPSAPPGAISRRWTCPPSDPGWVRRAGQPQVGSHVHQQSGRQDRHPAIPLQPRHEYAAGLPRGLPTGYASRLRSHHPTEVRRCALLPGPDPPGSSRFQSLRGFNHRFTHVVPLCLTCPTRTVWRYRSVPALSGLLPTRPAHLHQPSCPQLHRSAATNRRWVLPPHPDH